jgi:hypothetical protein
LGVSFSKIGFANLEQIKHLIQNLSQDTFTLLLLNSLIFLKYLKYFFRPPKNISKTVSVLSEDEEEEDQDLLEAKIVLRDVDMTGTYVKFLANILILN